MPALASLVSRRVRNSVSSNRPGDLDPSIWDIARDRIHTTSRMRFSLSYSITCQSGSFLFKEEKGCFTVVQVKLTCPDEAFCGDDPATLLLF